MDEELKCADPDLARFNIRVAPAPNATWFATTSSTDVYVYRLAGGDAIRQDVPAAFADQPLGLALGPDGGVHLAGVTPEGAIHATPGNGSWMTTAVDPHAAWIADLQVGADGAPRIWASSTSPTGYTVITLGATTTTADAPVLADGYESNILSRFAIASDGSVVSLDYKESPSSSQLEALVAGSARSIGAPVPNPTGLAFDVTEEPLPNSPGDPLFAVVIAGHPDGLHVVSVPATGPSTEVVVSDTLPVAFTCAPPPSEGSCGGTCHETGSGVTESAIARTVDGRVWLVYVATQYDQEIKYVDVKAPICAPSVTDEQTTATLHLVRIANDATPPVEVLTMPIDPPNTLETGAFGNDVAIAVRVAAGPGSAVRVLRVDTANL